MSALLSEIMKAVQEGIKVKSPADAQWIESELESILWKIKSARMKDLDLADTLRFKELIKNNTSK